MLNRVAIVGAGLIGTSAALALQRQGIHVVLADADRSVLERSLALTGAQAWTGGGALEVPDLVLVATPLDTVAPEFLRLQRLGVSCVMSDSASVKARPLLEAEDLGVAMTNVVGGHPMAGRERSGPEAATADLFVDRPWALCPTMSTSPGALALVRDLVLACGAWPVVLTPDRHDAAVAVLSHVPQLLASALAAASSDLDAGDLRLAGPGFRDMTRIADSSADLWAGIATANAGPVAAGLRHVCAGLASVADVLERSAGDAGATAPSVAAPTVAAPTVAAPTVAAPTAAAGTAAAAVGALVRAGNAGRGRLPTKAAPVEGHWESVVVVVPDRPGELARVLLAAGAAGVNVEDLRVEHSPDHPSGLISLDVLSGAGASLARALHDAGWSAHVE